MVEGPRAGRQLTLVGRGFRRTRLSWLIPPHGSRLAVQQAIRYHTLETLACATSHLVGMRVNFWDLTTWSWLMATAHGAGLMVVPALLGGKSVFCGAIPSSANSLLFFHPLDCHCSSRGPHDLSSKMRQFWDGIGLVAWIVYEFVGLAVLRRSWINRERA